MPIRTIPCRTASSVPHSPNAIGRTGIHTSTIDAVYVAVAACLGGLPGHQPSLGRRIAEAIHVVSREANWGQKKLKFSSFASRSCLSKGRRIEQMTGSLTTKFGQCGRNKGWRISALGGLSLITTTPGRWRGGSLMLDTALKPIFFTQEAH